MNDVGFLGILPILIMPLFVVVPLAIALWVLTTLYQVRRMQREVLQRLSAIEQMLRPR